MRSSGVSRLGGALTCSGTPELTLQRMDGVGVADAWESALTIHRRVVVDALKAVARGAIVTAEPWPLPANRKTNSDVNTGKRKRGSP